MAPRLVISLAMLIILPYLLQLACAANILAVFPSVWKSHYLFGRRLLQQLVAQQHNHSVTIISPYSAEENGVELVNIREIRIDGLMENWLDIGMSFDVEHMRSQSVMERFTRLIYAGTTNVDLLLSDAQVRKLLRSGERFDLLIVDLFLNDALLGLAYYYGIPTVALSPTGANSWLNHMMGNPQSLALDPSYFLPYVEHMNLWQRTVNTLMSLFEHMTYNFFHVIAQQAVYVKHFEALVQDTHGLVHLPHYRELTKNLSLALINAHPAVQYPRAYLPNMREVGGAHLQQQTGGNVDHNYKHLKQFIELASDGVVYISLGANIRLCDLPREILETFLDVFAYLKEFKFLLKWESEEFDYDLPENVLINSWFPQEDILAHSNVKAFISSCGLLSVFESIASHTPILAIPILPEQEVVAKRLQRQGAAITVSYDAIAYDALIIAIRQLTHNDSYQKSIQQLHRIILDDVPTSIDNALRYIELTIKTGGIDYLKSHANQLNFWRSELLDVLAIISLGLISILALPFIVICCILRKSYQSQAAAAAQIKPLSYRISLKSVGCGQSCSDEHKDVNACEYSPEPLRRTRSAYSLSTHSTSSTPATSTTSTASLPSFDLTPSPTHSEVPLQDFINLKKTSLENTAD